MPLKRDTQDHLSGLGPGRTICWAPSPLLLLVLAGLWAGCLDPREDVERPVASCQGCHGTGKQLAPPPGVWLSGANSSTTHRGVGAHRAHLHATLSAPVSCETCHKVPAVVDTPGHMDSPLPAEVSFSGLASARGVDASYNGSQCAVYCHAGKLPGGSASRPTWTRVDGSQKSCGSCHGFPPAGGHPDAKQCHLCHKGVVDSAARIVDAARHINGKVELSGGGGCNSCHGSSKNAAPPRDTSGGSAISSRGVGAHQAHVTANGRHRALGCSTCHINPKGVGDKGHMDTKLPAEVTFDALARGDLRATPAGLQPAWDNTKLSCSAVYCHGLPGASHPSPSWTQPHTSSCGSCHGMPPVKTLSGSAHPKATLSTCHTCHKGVVDSSGKIVDTTKHINGKIDFL